MLVVFGCSGRERGGATEASSASTPVFFGVAIPLTSAGKPYPIGEASRRGAELAAAEVNRAGGIGGRPLRLVVQDDAARPDSAIRVASQLVQGEQVVAVVGHANSGNVVKAAPVYEGKLPAVATSATAPEIANAGEWTFRIASSDVDNAPVLARRALEVDRRVAVLYSNDDFGLGLSNRVVAEVQRLGGIIVERDPYLALMDDFTPYLRRIQARGARMIFIAGVDVASIRIITQARRLGMKDAVFMGSSGLERLKTLGPDFNGTLVGLLYHPGSSPRAARFAAAFRARYGEDPGAFAALAYDAVWLLAQAARRAGPEPRAIRDYLATLGAAGGDSAFVGAAGTVRYDRNGDPRGKVFIVGEIQNGAMRIRTAPR